MTPPDVARLLGVCAAFDQRTVGKVDVTAWFNALGDLAAEDARDAVIAWYRENHGRIMPVDVIHGVRAIRAERLAKAPSDEVLMEGVDPDGPGYFDQLRARREAIASGQTQLRAVRSE